MAKHYAKKNGTADLVFQCSSRSLLISYSQKKSRKTTGRADGAPPSFGAMAATILLTSTLLWWADPTCHCSASAYGAFNDDGVMKQ
jgi:hypothetical protein